MICSARYTPHRKRLKKGETVYLAPVGRDFVVECTAETDCWTDNMLVRFGVVLPQAPEGATVVEVDSDWITDS